MRYENIAIRKMRSSQSIFDKLFSLFVLNDFCFVCKWTSSCEPIF